MRLVIADDQRAVVESLCILFSEQEDMEVVAVASNGEEAYEKCISIVPDIAILDMNMPCLSGIEIARRVKRVHPAVKVIIFTSYTDGKSIIEAIKAGVEGYILKDTYGDEMITLLKSVYTGNCVLSRNASKALAEEFSKYGDSLVNLPFEALSDDEMRLLLLICDGKSDKEIAGELRKEEKEIAVEVIKLMKKAGASDRGKFVFWALRNGLI